MRRLITEVLSMTAVMLRWLVLAVVCLSVGGGLARGQSYNAPGLGQFCNGIQYGPTQQANLATVMVPFQNLMYGKAFSCSIPVSCSLCLVTLGFLENRSDPALIGPGQRLFTVNLNGNLSDPIDLFTLVGPLVPTSRTWIVPVYNKKLSLVFIAQALNALLSNVSINNTPVVSPCGTVPICAFVSHEIPKGAIDGMNTTFSLLVAPRAGAYIYVYTSGLLLYNTIDYTITGNVITFVKPPASGTVIYVDYQV